MKKVEPKSNDQTQNSFLKVKSYSVSDILAAGGATAFAAQMGKNTQNIKARLKDFPQDAFLTHDEAESALSTLKANK